MRSVKYLSNKELIDELCKINNPTWSSEEQKRKIALKKEILYRLNEPWRQVRKGLVSITRYEEGG